MFRFERCTDSSRLKSYLVTRKSTSSICKMDWNRHMVLNVMLNEILSTSIRINFPKITKISKRRAAAESVLRCAVRFELVHDRARHRRKEDQTGVLNLFGAKPSRWVDDSTISEWTFENACDTVAPRDNKVGLIIWYEIFTSLCYLVHVVNYRFEFICQLWKLKCVSVNQVWSLNPSHVYSASLKIKRNI